ncbi:MULTISPECIES: hypothetical protein [unclassified Knoellia]|uniref:hypothetical protein n=1 Tax=Knoellia altitudinis TaxID=3404795 RepID=UPI00361D0FA8
MELTDEVVAHGTLIQLNKTAPVEICIGPMPAIHPPHCGGPELVGEVDWNAVKAERANGVIWSSGEVWAVGRFAPRDGKPGTFTLTQPLQQNPPSGMSRPTPGPVDFPQLCEDPYAGGGRKGGGGSDDQNVLHELLPTMDGYVSSWVSDGSSLFNVLVTGDAAVAHSEIRRVWKGGLCVEQRNLPIQADVRAAQEALGQKSQDLGLHTIGGGSDGTLDVEAAFVDSTTRAQILEIVRPWLSPDHVRITSAIQPLTQ